MLFTCYKKLLTTFFNEHTEFNKSLKNYIHEQFSEV